MNGSMFRAFASTMVSLSLACSLMDVTNYGPTIGLTEHVRIDKAQILDDMRKIGALGPNFSEWHVSPRGKEKGNGAQDSPINLETALSGDFTGIRPGDIVWLHGGTYVGPFNCMIKGTASLPINVRQYPGERAIIEKNANMRDKGTLEVRGEHVWFWDLEVANSSTDRKSSDKNGNHDPVRGSGINVYGANTKYINLVVHDNGHGFGLWNEDGGTEIYGCVIFNNGNNKKEHGIYGHNKNGSHAIRNNLIFNNAGYGLHLYANSTKSSVSGFDIERNTIFNNGSLTLDDQVADQVLVGGVKGVPAERIKLVSNFVFNELDAPTSKNRGVRLGYEDMSNKDVKLFDNYIVSKVPLRILWWESVDARGNTIYATGTTIDLVEPVSHEKRDYRMRANVYVGPTANSAGFMINDTKLSLASWRDEKGFDRDSRAIDVAKNAVFVIPNIYDTTRAGITIYNWERSAAVPIDLSQVLSQGDGFMILDAQDIFGKAVASGVYEGLPVLLPMTQSTVTTPIGETERVPRHSGIEFGAYLLMKKGR